MADQRILVTGAAGTVGRLMRPRLRRSGRVLRLLDIQPIEADDSAGTSEEIVTASVTDASAMSAACTGVDAVIHLGGLSREASWSDTVEVNITGTHTLLEAAQEAGVTRVVLASSNHAVGFRHVSDAGSARPAGRLHPSSGHLLRRQQGGDRGAGQPLPLPIRDGRHGRQDRVVLRDACPDRAARPGDLALT